MFSLPGHSSKIWQDDPLSHGPGSLMFPTYRLSSLTSVAWEAEKPWDRGWVTFDSLSPSRRNRIIEFFSLEGVMSEPELLDVSVSLTVLVITIGGTKD